MKMVVLSNVQLVSLFINNYILRIPINDNSISSRSTTINPPRTPNKYRHHLQNIQIHKQSSNINKEVTTEDLILIKKKEIIVGFATLDGEKIFIKKTLSFSFNKKKNKQNCDEIVLLST